MKVIEIEYKDEGGDRVKYCTTEDEAKEFQQLLKEDGISYNVARYASVYDMIKNFPEWEDSRVSDGEMLDTCMEVLADLGI